ncbi:MAG: CRISPR system precrRNA processing endoribonuclease RAMP protein Cas6 [[Clostridium] nexile]
MIVERYGGWVDYDEVKNIQMLAAEVQKKRRIRVRGSEALFQPVAWKMDFSGLIGELEYAGELTPFVPWLATAEVLHIGRNTTFGMGNIQVYFI